MTINNSWINVGRERKEGDGNRRNTFDTGVVFNYLNETSSRIQSMDRGELK